MPYIEGEEKKLSVAENTELPVSEEKPPKQKKKKRTALSYAIELLVKIVATVLLIWIVCTFVISVHVNHSNSAYPMIKDGDLCIGYRLGELREGDEVIYRHDDKICFGRIAAGEKDSVEIKDGYVSVEGYGVLESVVYETEPADYGVEYPYTVPEGAYFLLNDYREDKNDSRTFGAVNKKDIEGKVIFIMRRRGI